MRISDWSSDVCSSDLEEDTLILGKVRKDFQNVLDQEEALNLPLGVQPQDLLRVRLDHHLVQATVKRGRDAEPVPGTIRRVHPEPIGARQPGEIKLPERKHVTSKQKPLCKPRHAFLRIMTRQPTSKNLLKERRAG